jgi:hypothetical protein
MQRKRGGETLDGGQRPDGDDNMPVATTLADTALEAIKTKPMLVIIDGLAEAELRSAASLQHEIWAMGLVHKSLERGDGVRFVFTSTFHPIHPAAAALPITWVSPFAGVTDSPWCSAESFSFLTGHAAGLEVFARNPQLSSFVLSINALAINQAILPYYRQGLLRLIDGIRTILRLILVRVLSALSRCPNAINAVLVLLAASRRYGLRSEPSDYTLPVLTSMSVVIGEAARL